MQRRDFLTATAATAIDALAQTPVAPVPPGPNPGTPGFTPAPAPPLDKGSPAAADPAKLARISIMTFNFSSRLKLENAPASPDRVLEVFDIPQYFADTYGVHNVELQHSHFASTEDSYLKDFRARIEKTKSQMTQINVEFGVMNCSIPDPVSRNQAVDLTMRWVDHAAVLNCPRIMINQGMLNPDSRANAIAALKRMNDYAKTKGVRISVETRVTSPVITLTGRRPDGGPITSATPVPLSPDGLPLAAVGGPPVWQLLKDVVETSGTWSNPDLGGIEAPNQEALHMVLKALFPSSSGNMHTKVSNNWDVAKAIRFINNEVGYKGLYSIEVPPAQIRGVYETILANI